MDTVINQTLADWYTDREERPAHAIEANPLKPIHTEDRTVYGVRETAGLPPGQGVDYRAQFKDAPTVDWTEPGLKITRLRMVSDPGFPVWDITYCHGLLLGEPVIVQLPFSQVPKRGRTQFLVTEAKRAGIYGKGLGLLDNISTLN
ncbi:hypothetical protein D9M69_605510 [compost metagenome]